MGGLLPALLWVAGELPGGVEGQNLAVQMQIDAGRLKLGGVEGVNPQAALG